LSLPIPVPSVALPSLPSLPSLPAVPIPALPSFNGVLPDITIKTRQE
jgi:hypothetical protein